jgi:acetyl esterase/lipase
MVLHGGFWRNKISLEYIGHLCAALTRAGLATWNVEYRRVGDPGGGWPGTFQDVARAADHVRELAEKYHLDPSRTIAAGHSAGGHLAIWLGARPRISPGDALSSADPLLLRGAVSLAGVADLRRAAELRVGDGAVEQFIGGPPEKFPARYQVASPIELVTLGIKVRLLHGTGDAVVPMEIGNNYQKRATKAGDDARLIVLPGADHFDVVDPRSDHWAMVEKSILALI